jgi:hypothetical protein
LKNLQANGVIIREGLHCGLGCLREIWRRFETEHFEVGVGVNMENVSKSRWASIARLGKPKNMRKARARRIPNKTPLRYRQLGQTDWCEGLTFDISQSGVLFRADHSLDIHTPVEMTFAVPYEIAGKEGTVIFCRGEVVRTILPATCDGAPHLAAKILDDVFKGQPGSDSRLPADDVKSPTGEN